MFSTYTTAVQGESLNRQTSDALEFHIPLGPLVARSIMDQPLAANPYHINLTGFAQHTHVQGILSSCFSFSGQIQSRDKDM
jgi:hypothetical protein